jgi:MFS superfamily sulfate permease-like transporter
MSRIPARGIQGLKENWRNDLIASISVAMVALPLSLGIALASGVPPITGLISAIIGGLITTFIRGSKIAINGPAAALIAAILATVMAMDFGDGRALHYTLAAIVVSGGIQALLGLLKLGRLADLFPSSAIHGLLAAIGVIIFSKQMHVAMGTSSEATTTIGVLLDAFKEVPNANPFVTLVSVFGLMILIFHSKIKIRLIQVLPAPMWVLIMSIPFVYIFGFLDTHQMEFLGKSYQLGPEYLISIPDNPFDLLVYPDFSKINTIEFWTAVASITTIGTVASLASAKAIDKLDAYKRKTNLNRDLVGLGLSSMISGAVGGLPVSTVIVRSTVNIHNNAKTHWSNFFHGGLLLLFVIALSPVIQKVPMAALAIILVFTGFKLASPKVFKQAYDQGVEQLVFMINSLVITLFTNLLVGIIGGILLTLVVHMLLARVPVFTFFKMTFKSGSNVFLRKDGGYDFKIKGIANFLGMININTLIAQIPWGSKVKIDLSGSRLVDMTVMENIIEYKRNQENSGGLVDITGLQQHVSSTDHNRALKILTKRVQKQLSSKQIRLQNIAFEKGWVFQSEVDWNTNYLRSFHFFETRPIKGKNNVVKGEYGDNGIEWELSDVVFDEGAFLSSQIHMITAQVIYLKRSLPKFILEKEGLLDKFFDRVMALSGHKDIDFELYTDFSNRFLLKGENEGEVREFFTSHLLEFFENNDTYHIESNGESLMIFSSLRLAKTDEFLRMTQFAENLVQQIEAMELIKS